MILKYVGIVFFCDFFKKINYCMYSHFAGNFTLHYPAARSDCFSHSNIFGEPPKCSNNPSSRLAHTGMFMAGVKGL